ncbi:MAG TPA: Hsp70 family protein [Myxococcales bacterium]|jgi:molecular chaperone HscA|nr:Hsp70 family protein [Myxococcales bacterium]
MKQWLALLLVLAACKKETRPPSLDEAISVEQPGGASSQLFTQGTEIPTSATESFTTARDEESRLYVHVLRGAGRTAAALRNDGWWEIGGVTPAKAGEARVMVTFEVDGQGQLGLTAREEDRRLSVKKVEKVPDKVAAAPLTEPDDDEDLEDDSPE